MSPQASHMILGDARFRYYPLWEARRNDVFCYLCEAFWDVGADHPLSEAELAAEFDDPGHLFVLDDETLRTAIGEANRVAGQYGVMKLLVPVHFSTLAEAAAARLCNTPAMSAGRRRNVNAHLWLSELFCPLLPGFHRRIGHA